MYIDWKALFLLVLFLLLFFLFKKKRSDSKSTILVSDISAFKSSNWRERYAYWPYWFKYFSLVLFSLAFLDPHLYQEKEKSDKMPHVPLEGIAIYLVLDRSGSMAEEVPAPPNEKGDIRISKINLLKDVTKSFIKGRNDDLMGLIAFARSADVLSPLTLDHKVILDQLAKLDVVKNREDDGTSIGYAIYKTVNLIAATRHYAMELNNTDTFPPYQIKNSIIVLVTDGFQDPNPKDQGKSYRTMGLEQAAEYAKKENVRLYVINIDPAFSSEKFAPHRHLMGKITALTGGKFYLMESSYSLSDIYNEIDKIEKSKLPSNDEERSQHYRRISFYPYLIALGLLFLGLSLLLETTLLRKVP